ncbi:hypothetical protein CDL15_Pgr001651 [Punica granatum]|nr:hypothetical protein CDL15_Pgr001651 [Punica granatum]
MLSLTEILSTENPANQLYKLNRLLAALTRSRRHSDCLGLFARARCHLRPDHCTLSTALSATARSRNTTFGAQLHALSVRTGLTTYLHVSNSLLSLYERADDIDSVRRVFDEIENPDVYSRTTFLSACVKLGHLGYAYQVFNEMPEKELAVWNAMITGFAEIGHEEMVFWMFSEMHRLGVGHDNYSFASVLSVCSLGTVDIGKQVHCLIIKTGLLARVVVINALLTLYFNCEYHSEACAVFNEAGVRDEITFNAMINGLVGLNRGEEALVIFRKILEACLGPTELTFVSLMCLDLSKESAGQLHSQAVKRGLESYTSVSNAAMSMYSSCEDLCTAHMIFDQLEEKDLVSWNTIISCYARGNLCKSAISAFLQMRWLGISPDEYSFGSLLASSDSVEIVETVRALLLKNGLIEKVQVCNALVSSYFKNGYVDQALEIFQGMPHKNLITWNTLISGLMFNGFLFQGLEGFSQLLISGLRPNVYTLTIALSICANICSLGHGRQMHSYILRNGFSLHSLLGNSLIAMYSKCGDFNHSLRVFDVMVERDKVSWNSAISALAQHGKGKEAVELFEDMRKEASCRPDEATFTALISACSRSGLLNEGAEVFNTMVNSYGIIPQEDHVSCLLDLVGRAGYLDEVERAISSDHLKGSRSSLWTLFSACAAHGNLRLGRVVAQLLLGSEKGDPSVYVLLSNIYAAAGQWKEAADVREDLKKNGVVKQLGCSWIGS